MHTDTPTRTAAKLRKHEVLTAELRDLALSLAPGDRFPSQNELMRRFGVSDRTVLRSLDELRRDGWIVRRNGSGTFVAQRDNGTDNTVNTDGAEALPGTERGTLAVVALHANPFFRHCVEELTAQAGLEGLRVVCQYADHRSDLADALALEPLRPAAFLLISYGLADMAEPLRRRGHRVAVLGTPPAGVTPETPCVYGDHELGGRLAAERLLALGHRRIGYAHRRSSPDVLTQSRRWQSHCRTLRAAGLDPEAQPVLGSETFLACRGNPELARDLFRAPGAPTALAVWTDAEAAAWLAILGRAGIHVPEDVSVIGYDNVPLGADSHPPLDTVDPHIPVQVSKVLELLTAPETTGVTPIVTVTPSLLTRDSCAPPPAATRNGAATPAASFSQ